MSNNKTEYCNSCVFKVSFNQQHSEQKFISILQGKRCIRCKHQKPENEYKVENKRCNRCLENKKKKYQEKKESECKNLKQCDYCYEMKNNFEENKYWQKEFIIERYRHNEKRELYEVRVEIEEELNKNGLKDFKDIDKLIKKRNDLVKLHELVKKRNELREIVETYG
ncbi:8418_t:CDS:2 [Funneliformis geosporum]|uniref:8418_t:CDS:1 n=1 Tax=Funneliformis geosporum TaxID=1117311 RepID=A0A9W4SN02_9GLOM|nr:8418_t:CDS:2 [Funneliformis geosporum]